mgnify:CR=1 FL=1
MSTELEQVLTQVILTERAAQVFKEACSAEGKNLEDSYIRIGAKPGGCSGWKYELEWNSPEDIRSEDLTLCCSNVSVVVERECLNKILGPVRIDYTDKNLVEQGFVFEQLVNGHQCGCGESFTPVSDLKSA